MRLNVVALHDLTTRLLRPMVDRGEGAILNVGSIFAFAPIPQNASYAATKAFVGSFSEALHAELSGTGVSCSVLSPGPTRTGAFEASGAPELAGLGPGLLWQDAGAVAHAGVDAMEAGRRTSVPGLVNKAARARLPLHATHDVPARRAPRPEPQGPPSAARRRATRRPLTVAPSSAAAQRLRSRPRPRARTARHRPLALAGGPPRPPAQLRRRRPGRVGVRRRARRARGHRGRAARARHQRRGHRAHHAGHRGPLGARPAERGRRAPGHGDLDPRAGAPARGLPGHVPARRPPRGAGGRGGGAPRAGADHGRERARARRLRRPHARPRPADVRPGRRPSTATGPRSWASR